MKILVIRFSSMGDVILATSLFSYLKNACPESEIYFLTDARYSGLFKDDTRLVQIVGQEKNVDDDAFLRLLFTKWDKVIDLQNNARSARVLARLSPGAAVGRFNKKYLQRMLLLFARVNCYGPADTVALRYIMAASEDVETTSMTAPSPHMIIAAGTGDALYRSLFSNGVVRPVIALVPFSAWKNKEWPKHYFLVVGRYFVSKGWNVALLAGPEDQQAALELKKNIGDRCSALAGQLSLYEIAGLLKRCTLALGNDTGLSHLARACGVKTGVIFGSTTYHFGFFPFGNPPYRVFQTDLFCRPCHPHGGNRCLLGNRPCLKRISPETVIKGLEELHTTFSRNP